MRRVNAKITGILAAAVVVGVGMTARHAAAAVLTFSNGITGSYTEESNDGAGANATFPGYTVSSNDLLQGLLPDSTLSDLGPNPGAESTNANPLVLTDGAFGDYLSGGARPYIFTTSSSSTDTTDYTKLYYILNSTPGGHAITKIDTYTSMTRGSGRDQQDYLVSYATTANPVAADFTTFAEVHSPYHPGSQHMQLTIDNLAGVTALKFEFPNQIAGYVGYREIDVNAVPEPATLGLLAMGGLALLVRRRRMA